MTGYLATPGLSFTFSKSRIRGFNIRSGHRKSALFKLKLNPWVGIIIIDGKWIFAVLLVINWGFQS